MKFIHAADLHLDSPFLGLQNHTIPRDLWNKIRNSTFTSFERIVNDAIEQNVDFVLLVGDLFDRNDHSVHAETFLVQQLNRLNDHQIPVLISFGNHDYFSGRVNQLGYPENTYVFSNKVATTTLLLKDGQRVAISGFSFGSQWIKDPIIQDYPQASDADWNIGMLHGSLATLNSPEANYAPFNLNQLQEKGYDYWALGHIHKRQSLNPQKTINYSGNTQGRHINESGEKGYLMVEAAQHVLKPKFVATAPIIWQTIQIEFNGESVGELPETIFSHLASLNFYKLSFLRVVLDSHITIPSDILKAIFDGTFLTALQNLNTQNWQQLNCWITSIKVHQSKPVIISRLDQAYFDQAKLETFTKETLFDLAGSLKALSFINDDLNAQDTLNDIFNRSTAILQENIDHEEGDS